MINPSKQKVVDPELQVPAGAYVLRIDQITYRPDKNDLHIIWDIQDGQYKDFFQGKPPYSHSVYLKLDKNMRSAFSRTRQFNACVSEDKPEIAFNYLEQFADNRNLPLDVLVNKEFGGYLIPDVWETDSGNYYKTAIQTYTTPNLVRLGIFTVGRGRHV